ncbi:PIH1 domain-containing protein 1 [Ataeniobius toweri]|uniref:PIH1 domain-containing protein 1 n=1 Tax=Ataeniobius toweri TaxID=208326 RepID=A0ABU7BRW3_9TELE|nr:PIH1 domain-containing protein 1 [Ataeniobius toweri]
MGEEMFEATEMLQYKQLDYGQLLSACFLLQTLVLSKTVNKTMGKLQTETQDSKVIRPQPGICVKTSSETGNEKVFINICQSNSVPPPPELTREELVQLLQSEDPSGYRVPMSLGEPHTEVDNSM